MFFVGFVCVSVCCVTGVGDAGAIGVGDAGYVVVVCCGCCCDCVYVC